MTTNPHYTLKLKSLNCYMQDEKDGDEVFIKYEKERIWPSNEKYKKTREGSMAVDVDIPGIEKGNTVELELWDYDFLTPNDKLGVFQMLVNERGGPFTTDLKGKTPGVKYSLEWEVR